MIWVPTAAAAALYPLPPTSIINEPETRKEYILGTKSSMLAFGLEKEEKFFIPVNSTATNPLLFASSTC